MTDMSIRFLTVLSCGSIAMLLSACGMPDDGYHDASVRADIANARNTPRYVQHDSNPDYDDTRNRNGYRHHPRDRTGYYDRDGYYVAEDGILNVPENMLPPRGTCRIWFRQRPVAEQPAILESCDNARSRIPDGAYIIYGK